MLPRRESVCDKATRDWSLGGKKKKNKPNIQYSYLPCKTKDCLEKDVLTQLLNLHNKKLELDFKVFICHQKLRSLNTSGYI